MVQDLDAQQGLVLLGRSISGRPVTLTNGFLKQWSIFPENAPVTFHFNEVFLGAHFPKPDDVALTELGVRIPSLDQWLGVSGFRVDFVPPGREVTIHFSRPEDLEFELEPGLKFGFSFAWQGPTLRRPQLEASLHQDLWLMLWASPARQFAELRRIAGQMLDLGAQPATGSAGRIAVMSRHGSSRARLHHKALDVLHLRDL